MALTNAGDVVRNKPGLTIIAALNPNTVGGIRTAAFWSVGTNTGARSLLQFNGAEVRAGGRRLDADSFDSATGGTIVASQPIVAVARLDYANASAIAYSNSVPFATDTSFLAAGLVSDTASQVASIMNSSGGSLFYSGTFAELLTYDRALTDSERRKIELYLAARWGITLAPQVSNADAQDWINRVYSNGGTVSTATATAVNQFCTDIDAAGIRDRFFRMGIFCGSNLNAALVPLYRGPSLGGTQYGGTTDTNNAFVGVGTDYAETGATGGLTGNGTSKFLNTGLATNALPSIATGHLSVYAMTGFGGSTIYALLSTLGPGYAENYFIEANRRTGGLGGAWGQGGSFASLATAAQGAGNGHVIVARTASTTLSAYRNGSFLRSDSTSVTPTATAAPFYVFGHNPNSTVGAAPLNPAIARMGGYSIGLSMDATQAAAYYAAMQSFQTSLTRNL
jgi:hypothetical protein